MTLEKNLAMDLRARADALFVEENFLDALNAYDEALNSAQSHGNEQQDVGNILWHRSICYFQLKDYENSLRDAQQATQITHRAWYRVGRAALELKHYRLAKESLQKALEDPNDRDQAQVYLSKCSLPAPASETLSNDYGVTQVTSQEAAATAATTATVTATTTVAPKYQYYQSDKIVTVVILKTKLTPEDLVVDIQPQSLSVQLLTPAARLPILGGTLYQSIDVQKSHTKYKDEKVLIKLYKQEQGYDWPELWGKSTNNHPKSTHDSNSTRPQPYASSKDWNQVERQIEQELEASPEGEDAMNKLFQQIYQNADEDTRRAMIKSYQTSGGTVLSTNWEEVSQKDYEKERVAPDGMEWKTWDGDKHK